MRNQILTLTLVVMMLAGGVNLALAQENLGSMADGEKAFLLGEYGEAEKIYGSALEIDPNNYILLKAQANTKIKLKKFIEAEKLLDKIPSMPLATGRDIFVHTEDG